MGLMGVCAGHVDTSVWCVITSTTDWTTTWRWHRYALLVCLTLPLSLSQYVCLSLSSFVCLSPSVCYISNWIP